MTERTEQDAALQFLEKWYPCTMLLLGDRAKCAVDRFRTTIGSSIGGVVDAQQSLLLLRDEIAADPTLPGFSGDVAAFEGAAAALALAEDAREDARLASERNAPLSALAPQALLDMVPVLGKHVRVERYAYDAPAIVAAIEDCDRLEGVDRPAPCTVVLVLSPGQWWARPLTVSNGVEMILGLCDATRNCRAIVQALRVRTATADSEDFEQQVLQMLQTLQTKNVLTYRDGMAIREACAP